MNQPVTTALDRILDPVTRCLTPDVAEQLAHLEIDPSTQARLDELADKSTAGELTEEERAEYEASVHALDFLAVLQAQARQRLQTKPER